MGWKDHITVRLARSTRVQVVRRDGRPALVKRPDRLLRQPTFILSSVRSGSTLLRMMLNSHSAIYAPHELHLGKLTANLGDRYARESMAEFGWDATELTHLLWDRMLDAALQRSGKTLLVEKTPNHVFIWSRIARCWPDSRFIFLLRHPAAIYDSWCRARPGQTPQETAQNILDYGTHLEQARKLLPGCTVRYECLVADPAAQTRRICEFLDVPWEPGMLEYGNGEHGRIRAGLGDWTERIKTGRIQQARELPDIELPDGLRQLAVRWGYQPRAQSTSPDPTTPPGSH